MLVLTRKLGESIIINDNIKVTILGVNGKQIKLGIEAPKGVPILREEIFNKIKKENLEAMQTEVNELLDIYVSSEIKE